MEKMFLSMMFPVQPKNRPVVEMNSNAEFEIQSVLNHYPVGELVDFQRNERGYVNTSFVIQIERRGEREKYFLRRYKTGVSIEEIQFEHSIIQHLLANEFKIVAPVIKTTAGETFICKGQDTPIYYALFKFLSGEDRYTWINPKCSPAELNSAAAALAQFHQAVSDLIPHGSKKEPKILELLGSIPAHLEACLASRNQVALNSYLKRYATLITRNVQWTQSELEKLKCQVCPQIVIHCDYHPGNLQFTGEQVSALFDFDWSKIDARCFDVGLAMFYFFVSWDADQNGRLDIEGAELFLKSYQAAFDDTAGIGPLSALELSCLPAMITAGNLYVFNWALLDIAHKLVDPVEYLVYLQHAVSTIQWLDVDINQAKLRAIL